MLSVCWLITLYTFLTPSLSFQICFIGLQVLLTSTTFPNLEISINFYIIKVSMYDIRLKPHLIYMYSTLLCRLSTKHTCILVSRSSWELHKPSRIRKLFCHNKHFLLFCKRYPNIFQIQGWIPIWQRLNLQQALGYELAEQYHCLTQGRWLVRFQ